MTAQLSPTPVFKAFDNNGQPLSYGLLTTYAAGTTTKQATYVDSTQTTQNSNPIRLNFRGECALWLDPSLVYKFALTDFLGNTIPGYPVDNIPGGFGAGGLSFDLLPSVTNTYNIGSPSLTWKNIYLGASGQPLLNSTSGNIAFYAQTQAEINASVVPVDFTYPPGYLSRHGLIPNDSTKASQNTAFAKALFNPAITNGPTGSFVFSNITGADVYWFNGVVPIRDGVSLDLNQCAMNFTGTGTSADNNSGLFFAIRDFECKNGTFNITWAVGVSTSSGNAIQIGARGTDSSYFTVYDSLLAEPMGNVRLSKLRINSNIAGAVAAGCGAIAMVGGIQNLNIDDVVINGNGLLGQGITYEFGWATSTLPLSTRQSSHMHNFSIRNVVCSDMDNTNSGSAAVLLTGAYNGLIENIWFNGVSNGVVADPGEAMFYRPWVGVDDTGAKRTIHVKNITGANFLDGGVLMGGTVARLANSGYLQDAWVALANVALNQTCINGGNMYVCTVAGVSANTGGPTGTGTGIIEGTVTWNYVPLTANTDLLDFELDGFALTPNINANGVQTDAGYACIKNGTVTGGTNPIYIYVECTRFYLEGLRLSGGQNAGIEASQTLGQIWPTARLKQGKIIECYVYGNSVSNVGAFPGIDLNFTDSIQIDGGRINQDVNYNGVAETTQGTAVSLGNTCAGVECNGVHVGNIVGGGTAYTTISAFNGNTVLNPQGTVSVTGLWEGVVLQTTPTLTAAVVGNLSVSYAGGAQVFEYTKLGKLISYSFNIQCVPTYTTATGQAFITGLPVAQTGALNSTGPLTFSGLTKAGFSQITHHPQQSDTKIAMYACNTGSAFANVNITDFPTGGTVILQGSGQYFTA